MENLGNVLLIALAVWQTVDIWHHSKLMFPARNAVTNATDQHGLFQLSALLTCPYCLSVWVAILYSLTWYYIYVSSVLIIGLAASKVANVGNDICKRHNIHPPRYEPEADGPNPAQDSQEAREDDRPPTA